MTSALIIGAGPGLGAAAARRFAADGHDIALIARRHDTLAPIADQIRRTGRRVSTREADAADPAALTGAIHAAIDELGPPASVVYNAVSWPPGDLLDIAPADVLESLAVNAVGPITTAQATGPHLTPGSSLLITGGGITLGPTPAAGALALGKSASRLATALLAETLAEQEVHVATVLIAGLIEPGTRFDPDLIADEFLRLHRQPRDAWEHETIWR